MVCSRVSWTTLTFNVRVAGSSPARLISPSILSELFLMLRPVGLALRGLQIAASS
jgi:hypothetical protein